MSRLTLLLLLLLPTFTWAQDGADKPPLPLPPITPAKEEPKKAVTAASLTNGKEIREKVKLDVAMLSPSKLSQVKIAVLDYGFEGIESRPYLPSNTVVVENYEADFITRNNLGSPEFQKPFMAGNAHGRLMAQAAWGVTGMSKEGPKFYLLNANGPTLFRRAVRYAIEAQVDVILFSGHFEGGGNFDGRGPINNMVDEAIKAGIIWINAAGNHHGMVYSGPIHLGNNNTLRFGKNDSLPYLRFRNRLDENTITITLTWNDYREKEDAGTLKDLDLIVEDSKGNVVGSSAMKQIPGKAEPEENASKNPRERLTLPDLPADIKSEYRLKIVSKSGKFTATDRLRILITPSRGEPYPDPVTGKPTTPVEFLDATNQEELFPPADHARVITVGEQSDYSAMGPTADRRVKPDVVLPLLPAKFTNGEVQGGTSYSAAYIAGVAAVLKSHQPNLQGDDLMRWIAELRKKPPVTTTSTNPPRQSGKAGTSKVVNTSNKPQPVVWQTPTLAELAKLVPANRVSSKPSVPVVPPLKDAGKGASGTGKDSPPPP